MTVSAQTPINRSTGNGATTVFPYTFKIIAEADIEVSVDDVVKTLNVDYTVSGVGSDAGGNVTMTTAPASLTTVVRRRDMALVRTTDYQDQGELPAATLDQDLDSVVLMVQQVDEQIGRSINFSGTVSGFNNQLPAPTPSYYLRVKSTGDGLEFVAQVATGVLSITPFGEVLVNAADAAAARTSLVAAKSGANSDITSLTGLTTPLAANKGGTGQTALSAVSVGAATTATTLSTASGAAPVYGARAWCWINGATTGTYSPVAGGNFASVQRIAAGDYTVLFTTPMPDSNYSVSICVDSALAFGAGISASGLNWVYSRSTLGFSFRTAQYTGSSNTLTGTDFSNVGIVVAR